MANRWQVSIASSDANGRERNKTPHRWSETVGHGGCAVGEPGRPALHRRLFDLPGNVWSLLLGSRPRNGSPRTKVAYTAAHCEVLVASADAESRRILASVLSQWGLEIICSSTVSNANAILARQAVPLVFCEDRLADGTFRDVLGAARLVKPKVRVVVSARMSDENRYSEAIQLGAFDVIPCPCRLADVQRVVFHAMRDDGEGAEDSVFNDTCEAFLNYLALSGRARGRSS